MVEAEGPAPLRAGLWGRLWCLQRGDRGHGGRSGSAPVVPGGDCSALLAEGCVKLL